MRRRSRLRNGLCAVYARILAAANTWHDDVAEVRESSGKRWNADYLVLTVPPSVWGTIAFRPALPAADAEHRYGQSLY